MTTTYGSSSMIAADRARLRRFAAGFVLLACASAPAVARAQDGRAEALFREGRALLDAKNYDEACPKLAESQSVEPGAGTLVALSLCHEGQGKTATAFRELHEAAALGRRVGREALAAAAEKRAAAMEPKLSKIVVHAPAAPPPNLRLRLDDRPLAREELGVELPVDPGEHHVIASAPGKKNRTYVLRLAGAGTAEIVVDLDDASPPPATPSAPREEPDTGRGGAQRTIGVLTMTGSLVGFGMGAYFGGRALSESQEADRASSKDGAADDANARAKSSLNLAIVSTAAGTAALALGAVLYFTAPRGAPSEPARGKNRTPGKATARVIPNAGPTQLGVGVVGTF